MPKSKKTVCDLCSDSLSKGHEVLNCEGDCNCTVHRYCAGVTSSHFQALGTSSTPFVCQWCMLKTANAVIQQLQADVASLKSDLVSVRAEIAKKDEENAALVSSLTLELTSVKDQILKDQETVAASYASAVIARPTSPSTHPRPRTRNNRTTNRMTTTVTSTDRSTRERQEQP